MAKITGKGATLKVGQADDGGSTTPGTDTFDTIGGVRSVTGPNGEKAEIEVTDLASSGREYLGGKPDFGEVQFQGWHDSGDTIQDQMWTDFVDATDEHIRNYKITLSDGVEYDFKGYIKNLSHSGIESESGVEVNGSVRITGGLTRANS